PDDIVAMSALWDTYWQLPGLAIDIGASTNDDVWIVGTDNHPYRWNGSNWDPDRTSKTFLRIAVDPAGVPWATNSSNQIFRRQSGNPFSDDWELMRGAGSDIGIGGNGDVWMVGSDQTARKFNFAPTVLDWQPVLAAAAAKRIAVSPSGRPWIVTTSNGIQSLSNNDPTTGTWLAATAPG